MRKGIRKGGKEKRIARNGKKKELEMNRESE